MHDSYISVFLWLISEYMSTIWPVMNNKFKRVITDIGGYSLVLLGISLGPLPGPGGIPLILAGLGLLSIHNIWASRLRDHLLQNGGKVVQFLFPQNRPIQLLYDLLVILLIILVGVLAWRHAALWQISLAIALFFLALLIAGLNRDRASRLRRKISKA